MRVIWLCNDPINTVFIILCAGESLCVQQHRNLSSKPQEWGWKVHREAIRWKVWVHFVHRQVCLWAQMYRLPKCTLPICVTFSGRHSIDILLRRRRCIVDWMVGGGKVIEPTIICSMPGWPIPHPPSSNASKCDLKLADRMIWVAEWSDKRGPQIVSQ